MEVEVESGGHCQLARAGLLSCFFFPPSTLPICPLNLLCVQHHHHGLVRFMNESEAALSWGGRCGAILLVCSLC
jgi:hypothetical protein